MRLQQDQQQRRGKSNNARRDRGAVRYYPNRALKSVLEQNNGKSPLGATMSLVRRALNDQRSNGSGTIQLEAQLEAALDSLVLELAALPEAYDCPITFRPMHEPVIDPEGNSFDKAAIVTWLEQKGTSPITRNPVGVDDLYPNRSMSLPHDIRRLKRLLRKWEEDATHPTSDTGTSYFEYFQAILDLCEKQEDPRSTVASWAAMFGVEPSPVARPSPKEEGTTPEEEEGPQQPAPAASSSLDGVVAARTANPSGETWKTFSWATWSPLVASSGGSESVSSSSFASGSSFSASTLSSYPTARHEEIENASQASHRSFSPWEAQDGAVSPTTTETTTGGEEDRTAQPRETSGPSVWAKLRHKAKRQCKRAKKAVKKVARIGKKLSKRSAELIVWIVSEVAKAFVESLFYALIFALGLPLLPIVALFFFFLA